MPSTLTIVTILPLVTTLAVVAQARRAVRGTTLNLAWGWCLAAALGILSAWIATEVCGWPPSPWDNIAWYGVAILLLCPLIAVLGARRPGVSAWNWFVILPLIAVLGWPAVAIILAGARPGGFTLETPPFIGLLLVLVMGAGNYAGTRYRLPVAALWGSAVLFIVLPLAAIDGLDKSWLRPSAVWSLGIAALAGWRAALRVTDANFGPDRVWRDFRDQFGIVWAHRIRERINEQADQERWPVRLERIGFVSIDGTEVSLDEAARRRVDHTLRWLLRRFVDEAWLNDRLDTALDSHTAQSPNAR